MLPYETLGLVPCNLKHCKLVIQLSKSVDDILHLNHRTKACCMNIKNPVLDFLSQQLYREPQPKPANNQCYKQVTRFKDYQFIQY